MMFKLVKTYLNPVAPLFRPLVGAGHHREPFTSNTLLCAFKKQNNCYVLHICKTIRAHNCNEDDFGGLPLKRTVFRSLTPEVTWDQLSHL